MEESSPLRYIVYTAMVKLAGQSELLHLVNTKLEDIRNWMALWNVSPDKVQSLLRVLYDAFNECNQR